MKIGTTYDNVFNFRLLILNFNLSKGLAADSRAPGFEPGVRGEEERGGRGGEAEEPEGALRFAQEVVGSDRQG